MVQKQYVVIAEAVHMLKLCKGTVLLLFLFSFPLALVRVV